MVFLILQRINKNTLNVTEILKKYEQNPKIEQISQLLIERKKTSVARGVR